MTPVCAVTMEKMVNALAMAMATETVSVNHGRREKAIVRTPRFASAATAVFLTVSVVVRVLVVPCAAATAIVLVVTERDGVTCEKRTARILWLQWRTAPTQPPLWWLSLLRSACVCAKCAEATVN